MATNSRKVRGRRTELVVATYFQRFWGRAEAVGSGASGSDIKNTPYMIEVKAKKDFSPLSWVKQNEKRPDGRLAFVVYRANGMGEDVDNYLFIARMGDIMPMLVDRVPSEEIIRCKGCGTWTTEGRKCEVCESIGNNK